MRYFSTEQFVSPIHTTQGGQSHPGSQRRIVKAKSLFVILAFAGLFFWPASPCAAQALDKYGGLRSLKCAKSTGSFHTQKIGNRWWLCTPSGNGFFLLAVDVVDQNGGSGYPALVDAKYGSAAGWATNADRRLLSWGFNTLGTYANANVLPYSRDNKGAYSLPVKLPFIDLVRPGLYSMENPAIYASDYGHKKLLTDPVKSIFYGASPYYTGFRPGHGSADYFDPKIDTWLASDLANEMSLHNLKNSPYQNYMIGMACDDSDQTYGFGAGPDFPTVPPGHNNAHLGWVAATMSPTQTASSQYSAVYIDTIVHTKKAWHDMLASKYGTIGALNAAWGSNYTTFDSSGKQITGEAIGKGNGSTLSFTHALANLTPSKFSVQILVNGTPVGGDTGDGSIFGPNIAGHVNYKSGLLILVFRPDHVPRRAAAITVNYMQNGWEIGSGLMDEDGRPAHQTWLGSDFVYLSNTNPSVKTDFNTFLGQIASQFLGTCRKDIKAAFPNTLFLGPDSLTAWGAPSPAPVLQAAGQYIDAFIASATTPYPQAEMDFIAQNYGDKPYIATQFRTANADSAMSMYPDSGQFTTQQARGQDYYNDVISLQSLATSAGSHPYIGSMWWQYTDNQGEKLDWGLVSLLDNAYDGHEDVQATVQCSPPLDKYKCGGESRNYGNLIQPVKEANFSWRAIRTPGKANNDHHPLRRHAVSP